MIIEYVEQNSEEWFKLKAGVPSASDFDKIICADGKPSKQREAYMFKLAGERITGIREQSYQNAAMLRGIEMEAEAVELYELIRDVETEKVGVCYPNDKKSSLASPDRLIRANSLGVLEIKCPDIQNHVKYKFKGKLPSKYFQQVQGQMYVTGAEWCDFMSYYPGISPFMLRVERDDKFIKQLEESLQLFNEELQKVVDKL